MIYQLPSNKKIADILEQIANLLALQNGSIYRIKAYHRAAEIVRERAEPLADIVAAGKSDFLEAIPGIGESLSRQIEEIVKTGKSRLLFRLQGLVNPEDLFEKMPGIGHKMAERMVEQLKIHSLEELEQAAHDGRLDKVEGFGKGRVDLVKVYLAALLNASARKWILQATPLTKKNTTEFAPDVSTLLEIDQEYFQKIANNELEKIAP